MNPAFGIGFGAGDTDHIDPAWSFALTVPDAHADAAAAGQANWIKLPALAPAQAVLRDHHLPLPEGAATA